MPPILRRTPARVQRERDIDCAENDKKAKTLLDEEPPLPLSFLFVIFFVSVAALIAVFATFPPLTESERAVLTIPSSVEQLKAVHSVLARYTDEYYSSVLLAYALLYLFLQTFSIPGSIFLSFLGGSLFGLPVGTLVVSFVSTNGATAAYLISHYIVRNLVKQYFPQKVKMFSDQVKAHRSDLFFFMCFLRCTPFLPNWFINLASPIANFPIHLFWLGTFIGVMPPTFMYVKAGLALQSLTSASDAFDTKTFLSLIVLGFLLIVPTLKPVKTALAKFL